MPGEKEPSTGFKVVDRRLFREDGEVRPEAREERSEAAKPSAPAQPAAATAPPSRPEPEGDPGFPGLVQFLGTTALFQLGLVQGPEGEQVPPDLINAHNTIEMLEVLQRKTRQNLTLEESKLLEDILYELRMSFVEIQKHLAKKNS